MANKRARISDRNPLTATDGVLAGYEQVNKSTSQAPEVTPPPTERSTPDRPVKPASQQVDKSTSQDKTAAPSVQFLGADPTTSDKSTSQQVNNLTSQQPDKSTSQQVDELDLNKSTSQEVNNLASQEVNQAELNKSTSQQVDQLASQQANKPTIRKATFQVDAAILADLDRYHLQLQIEMGRRNAPYKEILVEEAIAQWLERAAKSPDRAVKSLIKRQEQR
jgi:hypothetical protein